MTGNLWQDWPVYFLSAAVIFFFIYVFINGNRKTNGGDDGPSSGKAGQ